MMRMYTRRWGLLVCLLLASCSSDAGYVFSTPTVAPTAMSLTAPPRVPSSPSALPAGPFSGYLAPDFMLTALDGQAVQLRAYRGRPVWINLWATWCVPCRTEMPAMQTLYSRYQSQGLIVLGVNAQEDPARVRSFVSDGHFTWQFLLDPDSLVRRKYVFTGIPSHVFVDRAGVIQQITIGELDAATMAEYLGRIMADPGLGG
ncbi:MAG: TlpA family protein disulfide reductase [Chloroflexota bacterium]|nr:TlpA family protein disulfide reductase [Chloroflexota bacterium]